MYQSERYWLSNFLIWHVIPTFSFSSFKSYLLFQLSYKSHCLVLNLLMNLWVFWTERAFCFFLLYSDILHQLANQLSLSQTIVWFLILFLQPVKQKLSQIRMLFLDNMTIQPPYMYLNHFRVWRQIENNRINWFMYPNICTSHVMMSSAFKLNPRLSSQSPNHLHISS